MTDDMRNDQRTNTERGVEKELRGSGQDIKGRIKDAAGGLTGDSQMQAEGKLDKVKGSINRAVGGIQRRIGRETDGPSR